jgi:hypothetical protein
VGAIAEGLVGGMSAAAKADGSASGQTKGLACGIDNFEVTFYTNRSIAVNSDLGSSHSGLRKR